MSTYETAVSALLKLKNSSDTAPSGDVWRSLPDLPEIQVTKGGQIRLVQPLHPDGSGEIRVQVDGYKLRARPTAIRDAAWPELAVEPSSISITPHDPGGPEIDPKDLRLEYGGKWVILGRPGRGALKALRAAFAEEAG